MIICICLVIGLGFGVLSLYAAKDTHDAEYGLGRHHDALCAQAAGALPAPEQVPVEPRPAVVATRRPGLLPLARA